MKKTNGVFSDNITGVMIVAGWFLLITAVAMIVTQ